MIMVNANLNQVNTFKCTSDILHHLGVPLPHDNGFNKVKNSYIKVHITVFVMIMVLMLMKYGWLVISFIRQYIPHTKNNYLIKGFHKKRY